jgi:hypothetical protein
MALLKPNTHDVVGDSVGQFGVSQEGSRGIDGLEFTINHVIVIVFFLYIYHGRIARLGEFLYIVFDLEDGMTRHHHLGPRNRLHPCLDGEIGLGNGYIPEYPRKGGEPGFPDRLVPHGKTLFGDDHVANLGKGVDMGDLVMMGRGIFQGIYLEKGSHLHEENGFLTIEFLVFFGDSKIVEDDGIISGGGHETHQMFG